MGLTTGRGKIHMPRGNETPVLQLLSLHALEAWAPTQEEPRQREAQAPKLERNPLPAQQQRPSTAKNK